ncbi:5'-phosphoribosylglycinamide transformylase [Psidium guajava]|nr:5'-phosphoribosylglycinamide transformylase [Psidium guajava]
MTMMKPTGLHSLTRSSKEILNHSLFDSDCSPSPPPSSQQRTQPSIPAPWMPSHPPPPQPPPLPDDKKPTSSYS